MRQPTNSTAQARRDPTSRKVISLALLPGLFVVVSLVGCSTHQGSIADGLDERILPPRELTAPSQTPHELPPPQPVNSSEEVQLTTTQPDGKEAGEEWTSPEVVPDQDPRSEGRVTTNGLTLAKAIEMAFRLQPRLRVYLENIEQARGQADIAFAPFLPTLSSNYAAGGFDLNTGGSTTLGGVSPAFTFLPLAGALPLGVNVHTGYELADLKMQWLLCDFGRRLGRYHQAGLALDIAQLQTNRAYQTVANEVELAYYQILRTRALRRTAEEAVRRAEEELDVAHKRARGGAIEREKVLRADVQLAQAQRALDNTEAAAAVAVAALNLAIGLKVSTPTCVVDIAALPPLEQSLCDCLQTAVSQRREFQVARSSIDLAQQGARVAKADFAPRIVADGDLVDLQQASPRGHADIALGFIKLEWGLFEGGKRVAELRVADSKIRSAMAQAESIADTIAFQVTEAYRQFVTARRGIDRARPAVYQAQENHRLVRARFKQGEATPADITDAETTLIRAEQDYLNSTYDYLIALARLEFAMGATPTPGNVYGGLYPR